MVSAFDKKEARSVMDRMIESLKELGVELNITFSSAGGRMEGNKCTFKIVATKLDTDGGVGADKHTDTRVKWALESAGVSLEGDAMGSIWRKPDGSLVQIVGYHSTRTKYPIEIKSIGEERTRLAPPRWFCSATQVAAPSVEDFRFWLSVDPDLLSPKDTRRYDEVNDWLTLYVPEVKQDMFFDLAEALSEKRVTARLAQSVLDTITQANASWDVKLHQLKAIAK
jgi:hypothetical protein